MKRDEMTMEERVADGDAYLHRECSFVITTSEGRRIFRANRMQMEADGRVRFWLGYHVTLILASNAYLSVERLPEDAEWPSEI